MWASIWSKAISAAWNLHILCHNFSHFGLLTSVSPLDIHGKTANIVRPRPFNRTRSWQICNLAHPFTICLCRSSIVGSILPSSGLDFPNALKFILGSASPHTSMLGSSLSFGIRKYWRGFVHRFMQLVEYNNPFDLLEVFFNM